MAENIYMTPTRLTASGQVHTAANFLSSILVGTDGANDPTVTVYNEADASKTAAKRIIPRISYDASALGLNGVVFEFSQFLNTGLYVEIVTAGSCEVIVSSRLASAVSKYAFR